MQIMCSRLAQTDVETAGLRRLLATTQRYACTVQEVAHEQRCVDVPVVLHRRKVAGDPVLSIDVAGPAVSHARFDRRRIWTRNLTF